MHVYVPCSSLLIFKQLGWISHSQQGAIFLLRGHLVVTFAKHPAMPRIVSHNKEFPAPNVNSAEVEKPWVSMCNGFRLVHFMLHGQFLSSSVFQLITVGQILEVKNLIQSSLSSHPENFKQISLNCAWGT